MQNFIRNCRKFSEDRGTYFAHDFAEIYAIDEEYEVIGQPIKSWRSKAEDAS